MTAQHTKEIKLLEQQLAKQAKDLEKLRLVETELKKEASTFAVLLGSPPAHIDLQGSMPHLKLLQKSRSDTASQEPKKSGLTSIAQLKHAKEQLSLLPSLKKKFLDLVDEHATSKTRYTTSMDSLRSELAESEKRLKRSQAEEARLSAENLAKTREVGRLGDELGSVRAEKSKVEEDLKSKQREYEAEKSAREEAETLIEVERDHFAEQQAWLRKQAKALSANASAALAVQKQHHEVRCEKLQDRALAAEHRALRAERKALEKQDQITRLVDLVVVLEEEKAFLSEQLEDLQEEIEERELQRLQDANLWKKHAAEAVERLAEAMEDLEDVWNNATEEAELAEQEIRWLSDSLRCEEEQVGHLKGVEEEVVALSMQKTEQAQEIATLQSDVDSAYTSISEKDDKLHELETAFAKSHEDCTTTQEELASARAEIADVERRLSSTEHHLDQALHTLQTSEGRNEALLAEVAGLHEDLMDYIALQETHGELCKTIDRLTRTSSLAQEDADELARINADLVGHSNPSQKIRHLDRLRTDLAEIKKVSRCRFSQSFVLLTSSRRNMFRHSPS